ncbi:hypothetical protein FQS90_15505 [Enterococcus casseliflavus]|uniref:hypothetical protein n=1 Tax=Enterococcus sp. 8E11_MSG4843 TaxID=1834190 RepID=UPI000B3E92BB|nr:hypothetical protein [Enterococcus sp. 8E11_MSG4843]MBO1097915.1 hypothetical protein [Enterococcus casseliflavus]MBO1142576.1 hypothetical protein [Enterococcus casseliflavus]OUZ30142.1 hypothetical protein A5885_003323 [Enterococcus sp. 8E11_MSG4843]
MSKKKSNSLFSPNKLLDEMDQLTMEELQDFEGSYEQFSDKNQAKNTDQVNAVHTNETAEKEHELDETKEEDKKDQSFDGTTEERKIETKEKGVAIENEQKNEEVNTVFSMEQMQEKEQLIEQLTFEIKELILENEGLQAQKDQLHEQKVAENKKILVEKLQAKITQLENQVEAANEKWSQEKQNYKNKLAEQIRLQNNEVHQQKQTILELQRELAEKEAQVTDHLTKDPSEETVELQGKIDALKEENAALQIENEQFQIEISEVLVFARRKANRTIQEAKIESERMVRMTEMRIDAIHDRAKEILFEVNETKESVVGLFDDLHNQVYQLSDKKLLFEELEK